MPASRAAVTDTATAIATESVNEGRVQVLIVNRGPNSVFLDDTDAVSAATGFELAIGEGFRRDLGRKEELYGICAATETATVHVYRDDVD